MELPQEAVALGWKILISKSQNKPYWFNTKSGQSVWEEPSEIQAIRNRGSKQKQVDLFHPSAFLNANLDVTAAGMEPSRYKEAVLSICLRVAEGDDTIPTAKGFHRFPPPPLQDTGGLCDYAIAEAVDETGLQSQHSGGDDKIPRHLVVWREGCEPPEVVAEREEEARLTAEAEERRARESAAAAWAAKEAAERAQREGVDVKRKAAAAELDLVPSAVSSAEAAAAVAAASGVTSVPAALAARWASKKDKRSIAEMTEDIRKKKARAEEAVASGE